MTGSTRTAVDVRIMTRTELALRGIRMEAEVRRPDGAGPSDDGHVLVDGLGAALPANPASPYTVRDGKVWLGEEDTGLTIEPVHRPRFYDLTTADGIPYHHIALLHLDSLASTVVQTCIRYPEAQRCRFCTIEESLRSGSTVAAKTPDQLAEVAEAAVRLDGVRQMVMTTGTTTGPDRGARHLARCVRAVREAVPGLPIQVQCEPPGELSWIGELRSAGATAIGIHVESLDEDVRRRWMPGKSTVPLSAYEEAWDEAVRVFGWNRVFVIAFAVLIIFLTWAVLNKTSLGLLIRAPWGTLLTRLGESAVRDALLLSLLCASVATAISLVLGVPLAWLLARTRVPGLRVPRPGTGCCPRTRGSWTSWARPSRTPSRTDG